MWDGVSNTGIDGTQQKAVSTSQTATQDAQHRGVHFVVWSNGLEERYFLASYWFLLYISIAYRHSIAMQSITLLHWIRLAACPIGTKILWTTVTDYKGKGKGRPYSKEHRRDAHLPFIGRWARRWINHYCLWRMASVTLDLWLPSLPKPVLIAPTHRGMARLSWPGWLVTCRDSLPAWRQSPIQALTGPSE